MRSILPYILAFLTQHPRYLPEIEWSSNSWTHNIFRVYEMIFWRRYGIKAEMSSYIKKDGTVIYAVHSFESACAFVEMYIRKFLSSFKLAPFRIYVPMLQTPQGMSVFASPYLFSVAFDAAVNTGGTWWNSAQTTITLSHTCTGSNRLLIGGVVVYNAAGVAIRRADTATYNSVSMTKERFIDGVTDGAAAGTETSLWRLVAPATGANSISVALSVSNIYQEISASSYTGVNQTTPIDSSNTGQSASSGNSAVTSISLSTTVVAASCWLVGYVWSRGSAPAVVSGTTQRTANASAFSTVGDSNGTVGTGSQTLSWTTSSGAWPGGVIVSIAPVLVNINTGFFQFM